MAQSGGGEKTEQPTDKRLRDARKKGQVAKSQDLTSAVMLIATVAVLALAGGWMGQTLLATMRAQILFAGNFRGELTSEAAINQLISAAQSIGVALLPLFGVLLVIACLVGYFQVGSVFAFEGVKPSLAKLNPADNFKNKFLKSRPYIELGKTILKIVLTVIVVGVVLWGARGDVIDLMRQSAATVVGFTAWLAVKIGTSVGLMFLAIAVGDFFLQRFLHLKELKMTKHEVKEEYKETEGNPLIKSARRYMHQQLLMQSAMQNVGQADVVVLNPTHLAVALRYDRGAMGAPVVIAKGADHMAAHIRRLAEDANVPMMRDVPLARALYELEIDDEVPEDLYEAVAGVLRWVYELAEERGEVVSA